MGEKQPGANVPMTEELLTIVRAKRKLVRQREIDFDRFNRARYKHDERIKLIDKLSTDLKAIEKGTYDAWQPVQLLGLPPKPR